MDIRYSDEKKIFDLHTDGIPRLSLRMFDELGVPNLFSTRLIRYDEISGRRFGGIRVAVMDDDSIEEASPVCRGFRDRLAHQIGSSISMEVVTDQRHTNYVHVASKEDFGVATVGNFALHRQYVDGVVTDIPDALLTVFGADCPSVYIADPVRRCIGLVHAGWKGTLGKIPEVAIAQMVVKFGCEPEDMYAAIGPGVCGDCYEMGDEVYDAFAEQWGMDDADRILRRYEPGEGSDALKIKYMMAGRHTGVSKQTESKYHLDLREANKLTLMRAGVPEDHIAVSNVCTMCNTDTFYSYRAGKMENEQVAMMVNRFK